MRPSPAAADVSAVLGGSGGSVVTNEELDELEERVHNLSSVLQTGLRVWRSDDL